VFEKYSYQGDQRQSQGIYYSRTEDGGVTWSMPEAISEQPIFWSSIKCNNNQTLHRFWQEERQSEIVTYHQISDDGGISWGDAVVVSSQLDSDVLTDAIMDQDGNLHFLQLTGLDDTILVDHQKWDGFKWVTQGSNELSIKKTQAPISFSGVVASSGNMLISMIMEDSLQDSREKNQILSLNKFLGLPETTSDATTSIFIATPPAGGGISGGTPQPGQIPTQSSPLANLSDSASDLSRKRNIMGILLIFVAFVLVLVLVRPRSKKTG
jgi:hypothetical protein